MGSKDSLPCAGKMLLKSGAAKVGLKLPLAGSQNNRLPRHLAHENP
jgi:hypothetical protein